MATRETLPKDVVPVHYRVSLEPDLKTYKYTGSVEIDITVEKPTKSLIVNASHLEISSAAVAGAKATKITENTEKLQVEFSFGEEIGAGQHTLSVEFAGELNDQMCGFYRSVFKEKDGSETVVACTQMEATECRRAFPCFDEPALKATFDISITADKKFTVLSNSDVKSTEEKNGKVTTHFNRTPKMSTYLVAFVVGELAYVESNLFRLPVRVYASPGLETRCQYAADLAAKTLEFFESTFGIQYPLPKCDMIGLHDFAAGAMENWGLITYRLTALLYTEGKDSQDSKVRVTEVVQHELAHQWFGNLVTMEWWEGLWLNEGFATWMSWYACNHFYPEWKVWEKYINGTYQGCLAMDALDSTHPIEVPVEKAQDVDQIFDAISYYKGSCVIRMVSNWLGEDVFIKGIALYLERHQYSNTVTSDLWQALSDVSGINVSDIMSVWTQTPGYPLLTVTEGTNANEISVSQHRYYGAVPKPSSQLYPVSLEIRNHDGKIDKSQMLKNKEGTFKLSGTNSDFFKLNADQSGIYRVKYSDAILDRIAAEGTKGAKSLLSTEDRLGLLGDLQALSGIEVSVGQVLTVAQEWANDPSPNVLIKILGMLSGLASIIFYQPESVVEPFRKFRQSFVVPLLEKYGYDFSAKEGGEAVDPLVNQLKASLFASAIAVKDPKYVKVALDLFEKHKFDVPADIRRPIFNAVAKSGTPEQWEELKAHYLEGTNADSGVAALAVLGLSKDDSKVKELLDMLLDDTIKMQDSMYALSGAFDNINYYKSAWEWFTSNWSVIEKKFPVSGRILGGLIGISVSSVNTKEHLAEVDAFYEGKELPGNERLYATSHDALVSQVALVDSNVEQILKWLDENK